MLNLVCHACDHPTCRAVAVSLSDWRFVFELIPSRWVISFIGRYLGPPTTYKNGSPLKMFVLKRGLIWHRSLLPDTSSDIAIVVESIREFCASINLSGTFPNFSISLPIGRSNSHLSSDWSSFCQTKCLRKKEFKKKWIVARLIRKRIGRGKNLKSTLKLLRLGQ